MDDNANGLLDEGCGIRQGQVQFMVAWDGAADVDLFVAEPSGGIALVGAPTAGGLVHSDDCPGDGSDCAGRPFETVYLEADDVPTGVYEVRVRFEGFVAAKSERPSPLQVRFGARTPQATTAQLLTFERAGQEVRFSFRVEPSEGVLPSAHGGTPGAAPR